MIRDESEVHDVFIITAAPLTGYKHKLKIQTRERLKDEPILGSKLDPMRRKK